MYNVSECETWNESIQNYTHAPDLEGTTRRQEYRIAMDIIIYILPVVIGCGTVGNLLSFLVLTRKRMRNTSVYFYLAVLACADTCVLYLSGFKTWIRAVLGFELLHTSNVGCKVIMFLFMVGLHVSAWLVVAMTIDRFVAVWFPLRAPVVCAVRRARVVAVAMVVVTCLYKVHLFWTIRIIEFGGKRRCAALPSDRFMVKIYPLMKLASYSIIPFTIVLALNLAITYKLWRNHHAIKHASENSRNYKNTQNRITIMLLTVSFFWLALSAPFTLRSLLEDRRSNPEVKAKMFLSKTACFLLMYVNHSVNFLLYCLTGRRFRSELRELLCSFYSHGRRAESERVSRTFRSALTSRRSMNAKEHLTMLKETERI